MKKDKSSVDLALLFSTFALLAVGLVMVYSASFAIAEEKFGSTGFLMTRHILRLAIGIVGLFFAMNVDYHHWAKWDRWLLFFSVACLAFLVFHDSAEAINGAKRWIRIGGVSFQPSELAKLALVLFAARTLSQRREKIEMFTEGLLSPLLVTGIVAGLIAAEPNFSTALAISVILMCMIFTAGARLQHLAVLGASLLPFVYLFLLRAPYRRARLLAFFNPEQYANDIGYQANQALIGLGAGGLLGSGLGQSRQKLFYLPEPYTDFVFAVLGEELGFVGAVVILALFGLLVWRGIRIALTAPDVYGRLLGFGITTTIVVYALFHIGVSTGLLPTTGVPLPFVSYGGMSLVFTMIGTGILLNISGQCKAVQPGPQPKAGSILNNHGKS